MSIDILNLPYVKVIDAINTDGVYRIKSQGTVLPTTCPACSCALLHKHGSKQQCFIDCPIHGNRVSIEIERRRFRCQSCGKTLFEPLPDMDAKRMITSRLLSYIENRCLKRPFSQTALEVGVDEKTVRNIFDDYRVRLASTVKFETPRYLGIDEIHIIKGYRAVLTNVEKNTLFDMIHNRKKEVLMPYFEALPDRESIELVAMDMWRQYKQIVNTTLPQAKVVIDKFHVQRMANYSMESVRKRVRKEVSSKQRLKLKNDRHTLLYRAHSLSLSQQAIVAEWSEKFPMLGKAHAKKEAFFDIWLAESRLDAEGMYDEWAGEIDDDILWAFQDIIRAVGNWRHEIFNYFDHPITNAYTESKNSVIRSVNRMARGYSFDVLRAKVLYDEESRADSKTTIRTKSRKRVIESDEGTCDYFLTSAAPDRRKKLKTIIRKIVVEYGPYLPTLAKRLENGALE